tara:strand:- start:3780 stop:4253 length:474 start_codon:yes stop_codon:yes gene_type:complete
MNSDTNIYEKWMRYAIIEAIKGLDDGEVPVGAVIVNQNKIIGRGYNQVESLNDATAHAEMIAITSASSTNQDWRLTDSFLFVTKEPCPMCAGAILNSRLKGIIYGFYDKNWGSCGSYYDICRDKKNNKFPIIKGGILERDCKELIEQFFINRRGQKV